MRRAALVPFAVAAALGAVTGLVAALTVRWWAQHHPRADFGSYAAAPRRYVDYQPIAPRTDWWALLGPALVAGAVVGLVVVTGLRLVGRRVSLTSARHTPEPRTPTPRRLLAGLAAAGLVGGGVVAVVTHFVSRTLPRHYYVGYAQVGNEVDLSPPPLVHPGWLPVLPVALGVGLALGLLAALLVHHRGVTATANPPPTDA